jgi:RimJ/RimL family protein N-acetyltransferase
MIHPKPATLEGNGVRLEPLGMEHIEGLQAAASDGELWRLFFTFVPDPDATAGYVEAALQGQSDGHMLPWAVRDLESNEIVGSTRYHDIIPHIDRVEIGYTWYAARTHRSHVNTACKVLLLEYAFETVG